MGLNVHSCCGFHCRGLLGLFCGLATIFSEKKKDWRGHYECAMYLHPPFLQQTRRQIEKNILSPQKNIPWSFGSNMFEVAGLRHSWEEGRNATPGVFFECFWRHDEPRDLIGGFQFGMTGSKMCEHFSMFTVKHAIFVGGKVKHLLFYRVGSVH